MGEQVLQAAGVGEGDGIVATFPPGWKMRVERMTFGGEGVAEGG